MATELFLIESQYFFPLNSELKLKGKNKVDGLANRIWF